MGLFFSVYFFVFSLPFFSKRLLVSIHKLRHPASGGMCIKTVVLLDTEVCELEKMTAKNDRKKTKLPQLQGYPTSLNKVLDPSRCFCDKQQVINCRKDGCKENQTRDKCAG